MRAFDEQEFRKTIAAIDHLVFYKIEYCSNYPPKNNIYKWAEQETSGLWSKGLVSKLLHEYFNQN